MKKLLILAGLIGALFCGNSAASAMEDSGGQIGVYAGAKLGGSLVNMHDRKLGMNRGGIVAQGTVYAWDSMTKGVSSESDWVFGGGLTLGYDFSPRLDIPIRLELDYTLRDRASKTGSRYLTWDFTENGEPATEEATYIVNTSIKLQTLMANVWFDIPTGIAFRPYLGGGIGWAFIGYKTSSTAKEENETSMGGKDKTNFAWSLGGGLAYDITGNWAVDLGYRYINAGSVKAAIGEIGVYSKVSKVEAHDIMLGLRYTF